MATTSTSFGLCLATLTMMSLAPATPAQGDQDGARTSGSEQVGAGNAFRDLALAGQMISDGKLQQAETLLVALAADIPDTQSVWLQLALARQLQGKTRAAQQPAQKALQLGSNDVSALLLAAEVFQGSDPVKAKTWALRAGAQASADPKVLQKVIQLLLAMRDVESALPLLAKALKDDPANTNLLDLQARLALQAGKPEIAARTYQQILVLQPRNPLAAESLAFAWVAAGDRDRAVQALEHLLKLNPSNLKGRRKLIALMKELGRDDKQIEIQARYLAYYVRVHEQDARNAARRQAILGPAGPGK